MLLKVFFTFFLSLQPIVTQPSIHINVEPNKFITATLIRIVVDTGIIKIVPLPIGNIFIVVAIPTTLTEGTTTNWTIRIVLIDKIIS